MKFIAFGNNFPEIDQKKFTFFEKEEKNGVRDLIFKGFIKKIYFRADRRDAVLIIEAENIEEVRRNPDSLPAGRQVSQRKTN